MKEKILLLFLFVSLMGFSQTYSYKKVLTAGQLVKLSGSITLSDSTVIISTKGQPDSILKGIKTTDMPMYKQYKLKIGEGYEGRVSVNLSKGVEVLLVEIKDLFSNSITTVNYFLLPAKDDEKK